ncbi:MAG: hypothetical protein K0S58_2269 [Nitrospira sp.]|jgi:hypothetical protein|nr:hypothetical protein [Nitrospira sp.]
MAKRGDARVQIHRPIEFQGSRVAGHGIAQDFSPGGCCIHQADGRVHCGMRLTLRLSLPDRIEPVEIKPAIVTWTRPHAFGVAFFATSQDIQSRLRQVYDQLLEAQTAEHTEGVISLPSFAWK